jgi:uncharacterized protein with PIN domain
VKFITDINLGKLAKWLRILGYDTVVYTRSANREFLRKAEKEERIVLTRKKDMATRQFSGCLFTIKSDSVMDQLSEIMDELSLSLDEERIFTLCLKCNEQLMKAERREISGMVPEHILSSHSDFHICKRCNTVFWPGTHRDNVLNCLRTHIRRHHP